jgi:hypothetical protein
MMRVLKWIGGVLAVPVYLLAYVAGGVIVAVLAGIEARRRRKVAERERRAGGDTI